MGISKGNRDRAKWASPAILSLLLWTFTLSVWVGAQFPTVMPPSEPETIYLGPSEPVTLPEIPASGTEPESAAESAAGLAPSLLIAPPVRPGAFQRLIAHHSWLAPGGAEELGFFQWEVKSVWGAPFPDLRRPLVLTPGFAVYFLEGPEVTDLPPRLYEAYLQLRWLPTLSERWKIDLGLTPGLCGDFAFVDSSTFRLPAHAVAVFQWKPTLILSFGAAYLDREDVGVVPVAGLVWQPSRDWVFELLMPRPRVARQIQWFLLDRPEAENWLYVAGEFGGGTWSVERATGTRDVATYRDFRLLVGIEQKAAYRLSWRLEGGYVFGRKLTFEDDSTKLRPGDTALIRLSLSY
ncbi:MAG: DUF6268 family outer membrane beta-barrel protein [Thermoguttaceae bacterium]|nr:DUF6268 family outer membrane beta-barrel protein [Thermoguttaceae bacterium]MDW8078282.1 DUF6268 family outer membrane beta-barrel protein [Thermoguttaceae bacterium]